MKSHLTSGLFALVLVGLCAASARAQVLIKPGHLAFGSPDAQFTNLASIHLDLFSCVTLTAAGVCTTIPSPTVPGVDVPIALVTSPAGQLQGGMPQRLIDLTQPPVAAALAALPVGQAYEVTATATGVVGSALAGTSPRSNFTVPFYPAPGLPATPGAVQVLP
jgi:hypothetical protein